MDVEELTSGVSVAGLLFRRNPGLATLFRGTGADDFEVLAVNDRILELTGWTRDDIVDVRLSTMLHPDVMSVIEDATRRVEEAGLSTRFEAVAEVPAGRRTYDITMFRLATDDEIPHYITVSQDITEARRMQAALDETQAMSHIGHWTWDLTTDAVRWTDEVYRIYGFERRSDDEDVDLTAVLDMIHPEDRPAMDAAITAAIEQGTPYELDLRLLRGDEERVIVGRGFAVIDSTGVPLRLSGTVQDVTDQRATERAARSAEVAAEQQRQALELNDDIVQGLATIRLALMAGEQDTAMEVIDDTLGRARSIISHLLEATSDGSGIRPGDLVRLRPASAEGEPVGDRS